MNCFSIDSLLRDKIKYAKCHTVSTLRATSNSKELQCRNRYIFVVTFDTFLIHVVRPFTCVLAR